MKSIYTLLTIVSISLLFSACDTTDPEDLLYDDTTYTATCEVYMNDQLVKKSTTEEVGMMQTLPSVWANMVTVGTDSTFSVIIAGIPRTVGDVVTITDEDDYSIIIDGWNLVNSDNKDEYYFSETGSITRTSSTKISFEGTCVELTNLDDSISFSGFVESEAFKNIK